jgi:hypothetical protein
MLDRRIFNIWNVLGIPFGLQFKRYVGQGKNGNDSSIPHQ